MRRLYLLSSIFVVLAAAPGFAQFESGSDGTDGEFSPAESIEIDLSLAAKKPWQDPPDEEGEGVYDPVQWAVVFKYTTIDIPEGVIVTFKNHPSGAPVVWLAQGEVNIAAGGQVRLLGGDGSDDPVFAEPGPGGFHGGRTMDPPNNIAGTAGLGPGGGPVVSLAGAGYNGAGVGRNGGPPYGSVSIFPLIGGSGAGPSRLRGSGAGGGAILIASSASITMNGLIWARGGGASDTIKGNGGSGGAIRLIAATSISGTGALRAQGGVGGECNRNEDGCDGAPGRIRVEAIDLHDLENEGIPPWIGGTPGPVFLSTDDPTLKAVSIDKRLVPQDPASGFLTTDMEIENLEAVTVEVEATNIPVGTSVQVRVVSGNGGFCTFNSGGCPTCQLEGTLESSSCSVEVLFPPGRNEIQLKARW